MHQIIHNGSPKRRGETELEKILTEKFPDMMKDINLHVQEVQQFQVR